MSCAILLPGGQIVAQQIDASTFGLVVPEKRASAAPTVLPELPNVAAHVPPLTLKILIEVKRKGAPQQTIKRTVSRTAEAIHIAESNGGEWFFARNSVDPRRVAGRYIDHASRTIVYYPEAEMRTYLKIGGWADALTLGLDLDLLRTLQPTAKIRNMAGISFTHYSGVDNTEAWWNEEYLLASSFERNNESGSAKYAVEHLQKGVDNALMQEPLVRYPVYHTIDIADWLEEH